MRVGLGQWVGLMASLGLVGAVAATPSEARACGGTFCDATPESQSDPMSMRVDQTGETVVFAFDETHVEAHVQINYDPETPAERFAWIVPVMSEPEISVASQQLFLNLQNATAPSFGYLDFFEACGGSGGGGGGGGDWDDWDSCDGGAAGETGGGGESGSDGFGDDGGTDGGGTQVVAQQTVGAFDYVLLQSTSVEELQSWLTANDYYADPAATEVLKEYILEGAMFAAFRLTNGASIGEVHPITIRYEGDQPCVPLRLTRIAAEDNMDIRVFFLGETRAFPTNYRHVQLNPLKLDWMELGANYKELVTMAVDAQGADGRAFVTEYFGPSSVVPEDGIAYPLADETAYEAIAPEDVMDTLQAQGLFGGCDTVEGCDWTHPLVEGIVASVLPVPEGVDAVDFYDCVECYADVVDTEAWDAAFLARAVSERIRVPGEHALALLQDNAAVTRMYTTISGHEMTEDPTFHLSARDSEDLVDWTAQINTRTNSCAGNAAMQLPDGRSVRMGQQDAWPDIEPKEMPWVELVEEHPAADMAPLVLVDNTALIQELLQRHNDGLPAGAPPPEFRCDDDWGDSGGDGDGPFPGNADGDPDAGDANGLSSSGCGCRSSQGGAAAWMLFALGAVLGRRRRTTTKA